MDPSYLVLLNRPLSSFFLFGRNEIDIIQEANNHNEEPRSAQEVACDEDSDMRGKRYEFSKECVKL